MILIAKLNSRSSFVMCYTITLKLPIVVLTWGFSATYLAQLRMSLIASMLVSGKAALHANSDRHLTASWKESITAAKCFSNMLAAERESVWERERERKQCKLNTWHTNRNRINLFTEGSDSEVIDLL